MIEEDKKEIKIINGIETTFYGNKKKFVEKETISYFNGRTHATVNYYDTFEEAVHSLDRLLEVLKVKNYSNRDIKDIKTKLDSVNKTMVLKYTSDPDDMTDITYHTHEIYAIE